MKMFCIRHGELPELPLIYLLSFLILWAKFLFTFRNIIFEQGETQLGTIYAGENSF